MTKSAVKSTIEELTQPELFQKIGDICAAVNIVVSEKELLEISLKQTLELFDAKRGSIFILKENGKDLILKIAQGMKQDEQQSLVKRMGEGVVGQVAELKQPVFVDDISKDKRFLNFRSRKSYRTPSFICAPLLIKDQLIGVINITDKESGSHFNQNEMQLLDFLSTQIALNYRRIQLYQKFKSVVKEQKTLKAKLGQTSKETKNLKKQIVIHEKLATIGKLAGGIAHEFNNPLDGVLRYTNLCLDHVKDDDVVRGYLLEIKHGLNRMVKIVKNLLACSRNDIPERESIDVREALDHALIGIETEIAHKNIVIEKSVDGDIPLLQDLGLERVLINLLRNAVDAVDDGGKIQVKAFCKDQDVVIDIYDNGKGIEEGKVEEIFVPFYTTKSIEKGCGLGLTIVGEIVKNYDGKINVESCPNKGTTFSISLPLANRHE